MSLPFTLWDLYKMYVQAFRLYIIALLVMSFFWGTPVVQGVDITTGGYYLAIFELEYYCLLLIIYSFRPSRFAPVILRSYNEEPAPPFKKKRFFWMVYLIMLVIVFGIPLLFFYSTIMEVVHLMDRSNRYIIAHVSLWLPALLLIMISSVRSWVDLKRSVGEAKFSVVRMLYVLMVTCGIALAL